MMGELAGMHYCRRAILLLMFFFTAYGGAGLSTVKAACIPSTGCKYALAYYTVQQTDTINSLIQRFQISTVDLQTFNRDISDINAIKAGEKIFIPFDCICINSQLVHRFSYTIVTGDFVANIVNGPYEGLSTTAAVAAASHLDNVNDIYPGNPLVIPVNCFCGDPSVSTAYGLFTTYVVQAGDQLSSLAKNFSVGADYILQYNGGALPQPMQTIFIPTRDGTGTFPPFNGTSGATSSSKSNNTAAIVGAVAGALVLVAVILICLICGRKYFSKSKEKKQQHSTLLPVSTTSLAGTDDASVSVSNVMAELKSVEFSYEELAAATNNFNLSHKIGQGGFASVYYGVIHAQKLAIKKMTLQATKEFMAELQILTHVHHTNLVQLIGYCTTNSLFLVYEYIENGTLDQHLHSANSDGMVPLTWPQRVQISLDAARGLEYIHEHTKPTYIHRDIKSANILIDSNFRAKVADFGLTKLTEDGNGTGIVGTFGYMSPEYALYGEVSPKLDVYAFGVVLFEIISGKVAIAAGRTTDTASSSPHARDGRTLASLFEPLLSNPDGKADLHKYVDSALNGDYPPDSVWKMAQLAGRCTHATPDMRPTMRFAVVQLMTLASSTQEWEVDYLTRSPSLVGQGTGQ